MARRAAEVLVECLEAEGVKHVFGIPGEETVDLNEALGKSSIEFVPVRHEQAGAYIAGAVGGLTGRAGVCLGTLGPGATNTVTAVADAFLDRKPLVVLTGQADLPRMHKESHQHLDIVSMFRPITKWNAQVNNAEIVPEVVRKAFKVAQSQKPGPTHLELPEDVMEAELDAGPLPVKATIRRPEPSPVEILDAAQVINDAERPVVLAGNGVLRVGAAGALRDFSGRTGIPVAETFMGKGAMDYEEDGFLGTVGVQSRDYELAGFAESDCVIAVGYDLVEHPPSSWNPDRDKRIVSIDTTSVEVDANFSTEVDLIGDMAYILGRLAEECEGTCQGGSGSGRLNEIVLGRFDAAKDDDEFPMQPPRALWELREALGREDVVVSDVGMHKLWIARMFPAHEPNTVLIANGLAGMGFALPTAIGAKLVHPDRNVVTVNGDGGFLMNCHDLETAVRMKTPIVNVIWENRQFGSIVWKQDKKFGEHFGVDFENPDFVKLAEAFGMPAWRCESVEDYSERLREALDLDVPSLIVLPIDYSLDVAFTEELGTETVAT